MGLLSSLAGLAGPLLGAATGIPGGAAIGGAIGGLLGSKSSPSSTTSNQSGTQTGTQTGTTTNTTTGTQNGTQSSTSTNQLNGTLSGLLGLNGGGLLGQLGSTLNGGSNLSGIGNSFLNANGQQILNNGYASTNVLTSNQYDAPTIQGAQVQAPSQNNINLSPTFQSLLGGGDTTALTNSLQAGNALAGAQFQQNQQDLTDNFQRNILGSIRGGAIASGQYGSSRQGIAEGLAASDLTKQLNNSNTQFGLGTAAANSSAMANAYESGQNRALSAAQGLSGQQYAVAQQDAAARQAADNTNVQALLATRGQNSSNLATGVGLQQGLLGSAANYGNADLTRLGQQAGILSPFLNAGATVTNNGTTSGTTSGTQNGTSNMQTNNQTTGNVTQPLYQNTGSNILGGALLGGLIGGGSNSSGNSLSNLFDNNVGGNFVSNLFGWGGKNASL